MRIVGPLARLYQYVAPLGTAVRHPIEWRRERRQVRGLLRACADPIDIVEISAEAVFRFAALTFDSRHITLEEARSLARLLREFRAIDRRMEKALHHALARCEKAIEPDEAEEWHDLISALQQLRKDPRLTSHGRDDIALAVDILRTIDICRRTQPPLH